MMLKSEPIYESLLARILKGRKQEPEESGQEKVLDYYAVAEDAFVSGRTVREIPWPEFCLLVSIRRGERELIPKRENTHPDRGRHYYHDRRRTQRCGL